jgi:hypothetical protein
MERHCVLCHASELSVFRRRGAPVDVDLDSYEAMVGRRASGEQVAFAVGAALGRGSMPPAGTTPSVPPVPEQARLRFEAWLYQGMPYEAFP